MWFRWIWWICAQIPKLILKWCVCAMRMRCLIAQCVTLLNSIRSYILFHGGILSLSGRYTLKNDRKVRKMQCRRCWSLHYKSIKPFLYRISTRSHAFFRLRRTVALSFFSITCFFCVIQMIMMKKGHVRWRWRIYTVIPLWSTFIFCHFRDEIALFFDFFEFMDHFMTW